MQRLTAARTQAWGITNALIQSRWTRGCPSRDDSCSPPRASVPRCKGRNFATRMGKGCRVLVCGHASVGKTAILEQLLYGNHKVGQASAPTVEDVYVAWVETERGSREQMRLYDTRGLRGGSAADLPRHYLAQADGFVLVYSVDSVESFRCVEAIKREIDRVRDKKEVTVVVLGNKNDTAGPCRAVRPDHAQLWARAERVRLWEVSVVDRRSLSDPFVYLASRMSQPPSKPTFPLSRRSKGGTSDNSSQHQ
uniref:NF-kappa-B inhibitor-interacting Ras-like protein 2 isoform X1 n=2 Tax=Myxine glutinosa TaxID=7769 RepID=UPI00358E2813